MRLIALFLTAFLSLQAAPRETTGLKPLDQMTADDRHQGEDGGLYGGGKNVPPDALRLRAEVELARIAPTRARRHSRRDDAAFKNAAFNAVFLRQRFRIAGYALAIRTVSSRRYDAC